MKKEKQPSWMLPKKFRDKVETINNHHYIRVKFVNRYIRKLEHMNRRYHSRIVKWKNLAQKINSVDNTG